MTALELIAALGKVPPTAEVSFLCPDGYEDFVGEVEMADGKVQLSGYSHWRKTQMEAAALQAKLRALGA